MPRTTAMRSGADDLAMIDDVGPVKSLHHPWRVRVLIVSGLLVPFMLLTYLALRSGSPSDTQSRPVILATLGTITGPFVGAIARGGQRCCLDASMSIATYCGAVLMVGLLAQIAPLPIKRGREAVRLILWSFGWLVWLLGGPVSFLHALS